MTFVIGIDTTGTTADIDDQDTLESSVQTAPYIPSVVLPLIPEEPALYGMTSASHRRGLGLSWPPECQIDYLGHRGHPRILLAEAWERLAPRTVDLGTAEDYQRGYEDFTWSPEKPELSISYTPERVLAEDLKHTLANKNPKKICMVVPDDLGEVGQTALLEACQSVGLYGIHLVPRPIAAATWWCHRNKNIEWNGDIGHVLVLSCGLNEWEVSTVIIKKRSYNGETVLIPFRDHTVCSSGLGIAGLSVCMAALKESTSWKIDEIWRHLVAGTGLPKIEETSDIGYARQSFNDAWAQTDKWWSEHTQFESSLGSRPLAELFLRVKSRVIEQRANLDELKGTQCLGIIADGELACLRLDGKCLVGWVLDKLDLNEKPLIFQEGNLGAKGAKLIAHQLESKTPTYHDRLIPAGLYIKQQNRFYDPELGISELIPDSYIEAGQEFQTDKPITGLSIQKGKHLLDLRIQRTTGPKSSPIHTVRNVQAELREKTRKDEPVEITARAKPGQGLAEVTIRSEQRGVFETRLNWKTMVDSDAPALPTHAWPQGMGEIILDRTKFSSALHEFNQFITAAKNKSDLSHPIAALRDRLNVARNWHDVYPNRPERPFVKCAAIPCSDALMKVPNPDTLRDCSILLGEILSTNQEYSECQRLAGWLYDACPFSAMEIARRNLQRNRANPQDLIVIGNAFKTCDDLRLFAAAWVDAIKQNASPNNWLRAARNLALYRFEFMSTNVINANQMAQIEAHILSILRNQILDSKSGQIYDNILNISPHLLKRRRFDSEYLNKTSDRGKSWIKWFDIASDHGISRQQTMANITLRYLNCEASDDDILTLSRNSND